MEKEFKLIDYIKEEKGSNANVIYVAHIKECIKRIREEFIIGKFTSTFIKEKIDKHTGFEEGEK